MDIHNILALLHNERRQVNDVILRLERLLQSTRTRKNMPTATNQQIVEGGKRTRTVSPVARAKTPKSEPKELEPKKFEPKMRAKAAGG